MNHLMLQFIFTSIVLKYSVTVSCSRLFHSNQNQFRFWPVMIWFNLLSSTLYSQISNLQWCWFNHVNEDDLTFVDNCRINASPCCHTSRSTDWVIWWTRWFLFMGEETSPHWRWSCATSCLWWGPSWSKTTSTSRRFVWTGPEPAQSWPATPATSATMISILSSLWSFQHRNTTSEWSRPC